MKKLIMLLSFVALGIMANAQIKKELNLKPYWEIKGAAVDPNNKQLQIGMEVKVMGNGQGRTLFITSNSQLEKVEVYFIGVPSYPKITTFIKGKSTSLMLESGAYNQGLQKGYRLLFYKLRSVRPIWEATVIQKNIAQP